MNGTIIACQVENISTRRDNTIKLVFGCQELSPSRAAELLALRNKVVAVYVSSKETISDSELKQVDAVQVDFGNKTQSQRLRNVLYRIFEKNPEGYTDFNLYYHAKMEHIIEHFKTKIDN